EQGIEVIPITFDTGFFSVRTTKKDIKKLRPTDGKNIVNVNMGDNIIVPVTTVNVRDDFLDILAKPRFGYGKAINPCIDCHLFMINKAKEIMEEKNAHFVYTGEVSGQRPMSQNLQTLKRIENESILDRLLLRPLSAKHLPVTIAEEKGWVDREKLLDIHGRSRVVQIELAQKYGIMDYEQPAGGCILTDQSYGLRMKDLLDHNKGQNPDWREIELLSGGRVFRLSEDTKIVVGRNESDNTYLENYADSYPYLEVDEVYGSPITMILGPVSEKRIEMAAGITVAYSSAPKDIPVEVNLTHPGKASVKIIAEAIEKDEFFKWKIG
ncbi:MAG: tRNA 4-thiouridine(8) synthase ThiI, partial [Calditrichia bacterium]|nr:tRNA 4-thiouridine(8) synthase ThiI [Calditrichia bacterium]